MSVNIAKLFSTTKDVFWIIIGLVCYACAWNIFVLPQGFVGGGLGGICAMIYYMTEIPIWVTYLGVNIILCIIAWIILGRDFSIKTVFGILGIVFFLAIIPIPGKPFEPDKIAIIAYIQEWIRSLISVPDHPIIQDRLLSAIMGGIIAGTGCGTYLLRGASTGGSDIVVMIVSKYKNVSWGKVYLIFDACVIGSSILLPDSTLETVAYGFVFMGVSAYAVDMSSNGRRQSVQMFIFTSKYREIADRIIHKHHRGATLFESIGWYTKQHRKTIFLVARKRESQEIFKSVKEIDPNAFIAVSNVMSVFGIGFDAIKAGFSKAVLKDENGNIIDTKPVNPDGTQAELDDDESTEIFKPAGGIVEKQVNDVLMKDEMDAIERIKKGREAEYNPNWQTPQSELMEIPEMPLIPKDMVNHAVQKYESNASLPQVKQ